MVSRNHHLVGADQCPACLMTPWDCRSKPEVSMNFAMVVFGRWRLHGIEVGAERRVQRSAIVVTARPGTRRRRCRDAGGARGHSRSVLRKISRGAAKDEAGSSAA